MNEIDWRTRYPRVRAAAALARVRAFQRPQLLRAIEHFDEEPDPGAVAFRVEEMADDDEEFMSAVLGAVDAYLARDPAVPGRHRDRVERATVRILKAGPFHLYGPSLERLVDHPRKRFRLQAYRAMKQRRLGLGETRTLVTKLKAGGDPELLEVVIRGNQKVVAEEADYLETVIEQRYGNSRVPGAQDSRIYWLSRVIEARIRVGTLATEDVADLDPYAFVLGVGRARSRRFLPPIRRLFDARNDDFHFVRTYVWALGQLRAANEIKHAQVVIEEQIARFSPPRV